MGKEKRDNFFNRKLGYDFYSSGRNILRASLTNNSMLSVVFCAQQQILESVLNVTNDLWLSDRLLG